MTARPDNIPLRRRSGGDTRPPQEDEAPRPQQRTLNDEHNRLRRFKIIAVLLGITGVLLLIALISYTAKDEANAQLTLKDMVGVIRGDETLRLKFDTTYNWLGLLGAVVAHWMFTSTIGMWSIALPVPTWSTRSISTKHARVGHLKRVNPAKPKVVLNCPW